MYLYLTNCEPILQLNLRFNLHKYLILTDYKFRTAVNFVPIINIFNFNIIYYYLSSGVK